LVAGSVFSVVGLLPGLLPVWAGGFCAFDAGDLTPVGGGSAIGGVPVSTTGVTRGLSSGATDTAGGPALAGFAAAGRSAELRFSNTTKATIAMTERTISEA